MGINDSGGPMNPLASIENLLAFSSRDWSVDKRDAWLYGIVLGWDEGALAELAQRHEWSAADVARLKHLNAEYMRIRRREMLRSPDDGGTR